MEVVPRCTHSRNQKPTTSVVWAVMVTFSVIAMGSTTPQFQPTIDLFLLAGSGRSRQPIRPAPLRLMSGPSGPSSTQAAVPSQRDGRQCFQSHRFDATAVSVPCSSPESAACPTRTAPSLIAICRNPAVKAGCERSGAACGAVQTRQPIASCGGASAPTAGCYHIHQCRRHAGGCSGITP